MTQLVKPRDAADWWTLILAAIFTVIVIIGPIYVASQISEDTDRVISLLERQAEEARNRAIMVNSLTVTCLAQLEVEDRTNDALAECIREGLTAPVPTSPPDSQP